MRSQNCLKERLVCIVKLLRDAWSSLAAVVRTFASCCVMSVIEWL